LTEPRTLAPPERRVATVSGLERLGAYDLITALDRFGPPDPRPGQFYMLAAAREWGGGGDERPYLPRAFSYARARVESDGLALSFLLEAVGPGTERLSELAPEEDLALVGPLGVGFRPPAEGMRPLLVGGGIGAAPLLCWQEELAARPARAAADAAPGGAAPAAAPPDSAGGEPADRPSSSDRVMRGQSTEHPSPLVLLGFRSAEHAQAAALFGPGPQVVTDDGSVGRQALVTELLAAELDADARATVYACGPPQMLEAVRALCAEREVPAQLAMESGMACGFGACFGCVVPTRDGYVRLCVDGPVLDAAALETALVAGAGH
jgi:dihydroorotate dehydrogenase electron transfer subunit